MRIEEIKPKIKPKIRYALKNHYVTHFLFMKKQCKNLQKPK